jgi:hypothetical protein
MMLMQLHLLQQGVIYGVLGLVTGAIWANYQWGSPWSGDPKQNGAAIAMLIYLAYFVLRGSLNEDDKKGRISAVYNIFAFFMLFPTLWILPRLTESLHPGGEGCRWESWNKWERYGCANANSVLSCCNWMDTFRSLDQHFENSLYIIS